MEDGKFKFEPIVISIISMAPVVALVMLFRYAMAPDFVYKPLFLGLIVPPLLIALIILPLTFKMLKGIPAIQLTHDQLINNLNGVIIDWDNVEYVGIAGIRKPFLIINLKDTDRFYAGVGNPLKRIWLKFFYSLSAGDVAINLTLIAGDNDAIAAVAHVYRSRFNGSDD